MTWTRHCERAARALARTPWLGAGAPIVALVAVVIALALLLMSGFARTLDANFASESRRLVASAVDGRHRALSNLTLDYAMWNDAYEAITARWDSAWVERNYYSAVAHGIVVFRDDGRVRYSWFHDVAGGLAGGGLAHAIVAAARRDLRLREQVNASESEMVARTMLLHEGALFLVAVAPVALEDAAARRARAAGPVDYVASVDIVDAAALSAAGDALGLDGLGFGADVAGEGRIGLALRTASGREIGRLVWRDERPGSAAFASQAAPIVLGLVLIGALALLLARALVAAQMRAGARLNAALESSRLKSEFIANMSHELRTPLNAIIGYAELIQEQAGADNRSDVEQDISRVIAAARHLGQLITDVLDQSKLDAGNMTLELEVVPLAGVLTDVVERAAEQARGNDNVLRLEGDALGLHVRADDARLRQIASILVGNALKFTKGGAVTVSARTHGDAVAIEVADTGIGMWPGELAMLFKPFTHANADIYARYGGAGLGLSLARKLARAMGGDIAAASERGRGARFTLTLPAAQPAQRAA